MSQHLNTVRQIAYVVEDMEKALKYWTEYLKAGPFFTLEHAPWKIKIPGRPLKCRCFHRAGQLWGCTD